jgi:hypothetical protein
MMEDDSLFLFSFFCFLFPQQRHHHQRFVLRLLPRENVEATNSTLYGRSSPISIQFAHPSSTPHIPSIDPNKKAHFGCHRTRNCSLMQQ